MATLDAARHYGDTVPHSIVLKNQANGKNGTQKKKTNAKDPCLSKLFLQTDTETRSPHKLSSIERRSVKAIKRQDPLAALDALLEEFSLEEILKAVKKKHPEFTSIREAASIISQASSCIGPEVPQETVLQAIARLSKALLRKLLHMLDSLLSALGIDDLFAPSENEFQAAHKLQKIILLISILSGLLTLFSLSSIGIETALIIGGAVLSAAALSAIYIRFLRPFPENLPYARNLTEEALQKKETRYLRREALDRLASFIADGSEVKRPVLLVGPSRAGKTKLVEDLSLAIRSGIYPKLKDMQVFYFSTADLIASSYSGGIWGDSDRVLQKIADAMGRHKKETILVFDDIHAACRKGDNYYFSDRLKAFLDRKENGFFHFIGVTDDEEYSETILPNDPGFDSRFRKMHLKSATKEETLAVLREAWHKQKDAPLMEEGALEHLYDSVRGSNLLSKMPEPYSSLLVLNGCLEKIEAGWTSKSSREKSRLMDERRACLEKAALSGTGAIKRINEHKFSMEGLEASLLELENVIAKELKQLDAIKRKRDDLSEKRSALFQAASKVAGFKEVPTSQEDVLTSKRFIFLLGIYIPLLESLIATEASNAELEVVLSKKLIENTVREAEEDIQKRESAELEPL